MKNLFTALLLFMFFSAYTIVKAQPVISSPTDYTLVDETAILTITFTDAENAGPSTYTATFTELAGGSQLAASPLSGNVTVPGLVSSGAGPFTIDVPAASLADNTVYTLTIDNTSDGAAGASVATINVSTGSALTAGTTTPPASPSILNPDVSWSDATGGFPPYTYDVYINDATGSAHAGDIESSLSETSPYTTTAASTNNEDYFAIIAVTDAASSTLDFTEASFTTEIATPSITAPSSGDNRISLTPTITWSIAGGTAGVTYTIDIDDTDNTFGSIEYTASGLTGTSHVVGTALTQYHHTYYVRVRAIKGGEDNASTEVDFITVYETPALSSPINEAKDVNIAYDVNFEWTGVTTPAPGFYQIQISDNSAFSTTEVDAYLADPTAVSSIDLSGLDYYTTYYWRVRATELDPVGVGNWSDWTSTWSFRTIDNYNPVLFFPTDGATDIPNSSVTLGWGLTDREDYATFLFPKFKIVYDTDASFTPGDGFDPVVKTGISVTTFFLGLDPGATYWWKVITVKDANEGESYQTSISSGALTVGTTYRVTVAGATDLSGVGGPAVPTIGDEFTVTATSVAALTPAWDATTEVIVAGDVGTSPTWSFTTSGAVVKPTIAYPKDETTVYSQTPILYWYTTGFNPIHEYEIEWTDDPTGSPLSANGTAYAAITNPKKSSIPGMFSYPTPALDGGKHYYWHVRTIIGTTVSDWSDAEDFFTFDGVDAAKPNPAYPTGGVEVYSKFPRLYWTLNGPSQGLLYEVYYGPTLATGEVDTSGTEGTDWYKITGISQLYVTLYDGIVGGSTYYWQIRSWNGTTYSDFSDYAEFSIYDFSADLIPILSWPIGGNLVYSTDVNFAWHVEGPSLGITYEMDIAVDATGGTDVDGVADHTGLTSNLLTLSLSSGTSYEWRVRVEGETTWSDIETFTVISGGGSTVPVLNWPVGGATVWSTSQDLGWTLIGGGSPTFEVQVFTDAGLTTHFGASPFTGVSDDSYTLTGLTAGATYYWRVRVEPSEPWSNVEVFVVFSGLSPEAPPTLAPVPRLGSPVEGVEVSTSSPTLSFFSPAYTEGEITYEVEYSQNSDFSNSIVKADLSSPRYDAQGLSNGTWYWRARGKDADGTYSGYSDKGTFEVTGVTGVESEEGLPQNYELSQNYPNPFNPSTQIKFSLPEANHVTLKIYNMLGQEIRTLINNQSNAGVYTVNWNGKDNYGHKVSSGAYIYQIVSGEFVQTKKMILLK